MVHDNTIDPARSPSASKAFSELLLGPFDEDKLTECAIRARESLGAPADLAIVFLSSEFVGQLADIIELIQIHVRCSKVIGCSAGGFVGTGVEEEGSLGLSLMVLSMPKAELLIRPLSTETEEAPSEQAWKEVHTWAQEGASGFMMISHPSFMSEAWIQKWNRHAHRCPTYGGLASGSFKADDLFIFDESGRLDSAAIVVGFRGGVQMNGFVSQGCRPIGEPFTITKAEKNFVHQLAFKKAFDQLQHTFNSLSDEAQEDAQGNILVGLAVNEYIEDFGTGDFLVRSILGGDPKNGILAIGAYPRVGQTLQFQIRDKETAKEDLNSKLAQIKWSESLPPFAAINFSCVARGEDFFKEPHYDAQAVTCYFGPLPMTGFFCSGEIGTVMGETFMHGFSTSMIFLTDL